MCIACALPKGTKISQKEFENCWDNNPDGGGYVYLGEDGKFYVFKHMEYEPFRKAFEFDHKKHGEHSPFMLHFRIKSQGVVDLSNVHPFKVNEDVFMMHNGTFHFMPMIKDDPRSDTRMLVEEYLSTLPRNFLRNKGIAFTLSQMFGSNRVCFLDKYGDFSIFNRKSGEESENRWFSNTAFKHPKYVGSTTTQQSGGKHSSAMPNSAEQWSNRQTYTSKGTINLYLSHCVLCRGLFSSVKFDHSYKVCDKCKADVETWGKAHGLYLSDALKVFKESAKLHDYKEDIDASNVLSLPVPTQETMAEFFHNGIVAADEKESAALRRQFAGLDLYY